MTIDNIIKQTIERNPNQPEFHQAVGEVLHSLQQFITDNPIYQEQSLLQRLVEPERTISFRVTWVDDAGEVQVNKGYRVQFNSCLGPYKGGLRFHPSVNLSILKFLGFEQVFKNSLTGLPLGGGKGGSDFDPKSKSDMEIMRFCQAFMSELYRHIGPNTDVPAGDIGVGAREIGYLFGMYRKLRNEWTGVLTGKGIGYGGSLGRTEATGYGLIYFVQHALSHIDDDISGKKVLVSGSGNVALHAIEKALELGAIVLTASDSDGTIVVEDGFTSDLLVALKEHKTIKHGRLKEFAKQHKLTYLTGENPRGVDADIALPCATQNELDLKSAKLLIKHKIIMLAEGANMPTTKEATDYFVENKIIVIPGKASNAGGVTVSGLEMSQNSTRVPWTSEQVDTKLQEIMTDIHTKIAEYGTDSKDAINYTKGANIVGFVRVADAMLAQGIV